MSYEEDSLRWQKTALRLLDLRKSSDDSFFTDINVILDELNSLDFSSHVVQNHEEALQVLLKCCTLVPGNGINDLLATKFCQLMINLISRQKVSINQTICDSLLGFLTGSIQCCKKWAFINHLRALDAVISDNGPLCSKFADKLLTSPPEGLLTSLIDGTGWDIDVRCKAMNCVGNICAKGPADSSIDEQYINKSFEMILNTLRFTPCEKMDEMSHYRLVLSALRSLQTVQTVLPTVKKDYEQPLLAALKNCMFCGLPGYHAKFVERSNSDQLGNTYGMHSDDLSSINLDTVPLKSRAYQNAIALNSKKKKKRHNKNKNYTQHPNYTMPSSGPKFRRDYSSVDALMPSFAKTSITSATPSQKVPTSSLMSGHHQSNVPNEKSATHPPSAKENEETQVMEKDDSSSGNAGDTSSGSEAVSATSSDSDFSDSEAGQAARLRSITLKIRQNALTCMQVVVKGLEKKALFGYWSSFIPDSASGSTWSLFTIILRDPSPKSRAAGVAVLSELLDHSRPFLAAAEDRDEKSAVLLSRPFTSFSGRLGATVHETHRHLLQALLAETSMPTKLNMMKCLSILILNSPYNRLREGLMTRIVQQIRPLLKSRDFSIRVTTLTCLGMVISVHAPLNEVIELMSKPHHGSDSRENQTQGHTSANEPASASGLAEETRSGHISHETHPWLVSTCIDLVTRQHCIDVQPLVVRVEAIQVLIAFVRNYFEIISSCIDDLTKLSCACMEDDQGIAIFAIKLLLELGRTMNTCLTDGNKQSQVKISKHQLLDFWMGLLNGSLIKILQGINLKLLTSAIDCLTNIGAQIFELLPEDKRILCITMLLGFCNDEDKNVKASAVRAVGVLVLYPCLREDVLFVADTANAVLTCMEDQILTVRMRAAWSLGNLSDTLVANKSSQASAFVHDFSDMLLLKLLDLAITASDDHEKVKSNAVRALGNFLNYIKPTTLEKRGFSSCVENAVKALVSNVGSGLMKVRWNACYGIGNMFRNSALPIGSAAWTADVFNVLTTVIQDCKNFKVRINAVLSLSVPAERHCYGEASQFLSIFEVLVKVLESSSNLTEFSEFKYQENLQEQLCNTLCHLISLTTEEDLVLLHPILDKNSDVLHYVTEHVTSVLSKNTDEEEKVEASEENPEDNDPSTKTTSNSQKVRQAQAACNHIFEEVKQDLPAVLILRKVLTVKQTQPTLTGHSLAND